MKAAYAARRNGSIDFMKFLFTLMVMCFHSSKFFPGGYIAVEFFFIVSGFLMAKTMKKREAAYTPLGKETVSFVLHKAGSIFPFYVVAWFMSFFAAQIAGQIEAAASSTEFFRSFYNIFMLEMSGSYDMGHRIMGSWYISAMLLAMLVLYPLRRRFTDVFDHIIAPVLVLLFTGYAYQQGKGISLTVTYIPHLFIYNGLFRALAEISLGCICYHVVAKFIKLRFTVFGRILVTLGELLGYGTVFFFAATTSRSDIDLVLLPILAASVSLSFSGKSLLSGLFNHKPFYFLGSFCLQLYLTHEAVRTKILPLLQQIYPLSLLMDNTWGYLLVFIYVTVVFALFCYVIGTLLQLIIPKLGSLLKKCIIAT